MADPRFYQNAPPLSIAHAARLCGGEVTQAGEGDNLTITHASSLDGAILPGAVVFLSDQKKISALRDCKDIVCITKPDFAELIPNELAVITAPFAQSAFAQICDHLHKSYAETDATDSLPEPSIAASALVAPTAYVSPGAKIGDGTRINHGAFIGPGCQIGDDCRIGVNTVISHAVVGGGCQIMAGTVIGEAGFGYVLEKTDTGERQVRMPQIGRVLIGDLVDIGANCTIDRGGLGDTMIGDHSKLDNLIHIAHNVILGKNCVIAGQVGLSGSSRFGDRVMIGGQAGTADHLTIGNDTVLLARAGLMRNMPDGARWGGYPAQPARHWLREVAAMAKLAQRKKK